MRTLQATRDIRKVSLWLGHESPQSTEIYLQADPAEKLEVLEAVIPPSLRKGTFSPPDKLIAALRRP
jgi:integrase